MTSDRPANLTDAEKAAWMEGPEGRQHLREAELRPIRFEPLPRPSTVAEWLTLLGEVDRQVVELMVSGSPCSEVAEQLGDCVTVEEVRERVRSLGERFEALFGRGPMSPEARQVRAALATAA